MLPHGDGAERIEVGAIILHDDGTVTTEGDDVVGAVATVLLSIVAVLPSLLPLLLLDNITLAIHISSIVSLVVIFATGYRWGIHTGTSPWKTGLLLASVCLAMVLVAALLEG